MDIEKKYKLLLNIHRAAHFEWIRAVEKLYPDGDSLKIVKIYWDEVAKDTAKAYLKALNREKPLAPQIAELIVKSSLAMGEQAKLMENEKGQAVVHHDGCPWWDWHKKKGMEDLDQPGCDYWFSKTVEYINEALGSSVEVKTECALPDGSDCCRRVFYEV